MEIVIKLAGLLGLRREEIAGLKWNNVDLSIANHPCLPEAVFARHHSLSSVDIKQELMLV